MTVHASLEQLSSYLDAELAKRERAELEGHLSDCPSCRRRLDGLRGVVARLERLEQQVPPRDLSFLVERRVAAETGRDGLRNRLEETVKTFLVQPSLTPVFGLVVALALILYLFSFGVARHQERGTRLVVPGPALQTETVRTVAGREFTLSAGVWIERGLERASSLELLDLSNGETIPDELAPFAQLGPQVRLSYRGRPVMVVFP